MTDDATRRQNTASRPEQSTWVSANAGSGKTRVLTDRVARLLLSGTDPQKILCLTYTKAAAAEMQNRLFQRLGNWAMLPDTELRVALNRIGENGDRYDVGRLAKTRTYFARALETPGGLKIQTIHAFCANILRRFPVEAGVSPHFVEMDEAQVSDLQSQVLRDMAEADDTSALDSLAGHLTDEGALVALLKEVVSKKSAFLAYDRASLAELLGIDPTETESDVLARTMGQIKDELSKTLLEYLSVNGKAAEAKAAKALAEFSASPSEHKYLDVERCLLTQKYEPRKHIPSVQILEVHPEFQSTFDRIFDLVLGNRQTILSVRILERSDSLARFATDFLDRFELAKAARNFLDFDDLIERTHFLLSSREMTDWVLYRLDYGIDHILVDEAQDTSPLQWEIIRRLTDDLTAGETSRSDKRTIFVVGDKKQSIFSFQGADPKRFADEKLYFADRFRNIDQRLEEIAFPTSFRSAQPILQLVDQVFSDGEIDLGEVPQHVALGQTPGRIDLWDFIEPDTEKKAAEWWEPEDLVEDAKPALQLAAKVARYIHSNIQAGTLIHTKDGSRKLVAGDFLVIVRSRSPFFHKLINCLKDLNVPVAGADRLKLTQQIAVRDLLSLLRFLENDVDDLSLAEVLRSPIFGLSEQDLFTLAYDRKGSLWDALKRSSHDETVDVLTELRRQVDFIRPFELLTQILTKYDARRKLTSRLGAEAEDAIDEFLAQSLHFESGQPPTLTGFISWISSKDMEIKRDMEASNNEVRVMSIHGAKGLEAPVVILPDVGKFEPSRRKPMINSLQNQPVWVGSKENSPTPLLEIENARQAAEASEYARLLYVALTRAENWLVVAGAGTRSKRANQWYNRVEAAMDALCAKEDQAGVKTKSYRWQGEVVGLRTDPDELVELPRWIDKPPEAALKSPRVIAPSQFSGPHALSGEINEDGTERGNLIHRLLEVLPDADQDDWPLIIASHCRNSFDPKEIGDEVSKVLLNSEFTELFGPDSIAEVSLTGTLPKLDDQTILGRVDRVVLLEGKVLVVDFKTNSVVPDSPEQVPKAILAQQAAYHASLSQIYPDREVQTAILWTRTASLMYLPHGLVNTALETVTLS